MNPMLNMSSVRSARGVGSEPVMAEFTIVSDVSEGRLDKTSSVPLSCHECRFNDVSRVKLLNEAGSVPAKLSPSSDNDCSIVSEPKDGGS